MSYTQAITPDPDIPCEPGWCLQYVRQAFGLPARYGSATEAWEASATQHPGRDIPEGFWVPAWYGVDGVPEGHVVLVAPDGSVYSTTDAGRYTPRHHANLADLESVYARSGLPLTWRGWTEDVAGYTVITPKDEDPMTPDTIFTSKDGSAVTLQTLLNSIDTKIDGFQGFDRDVRATFDVVRAQNTALTTAVAALSGLIGHEQGLTAADVQAAVSAAIANGLTITITPAT